MKVVHSSEELDTTVYFSGYDLKKVSAIGSTPEDMTLPANNKPFSGCYKYSVSTSTDIGLYNTLYS